MGLNPKIMNKVLRLISVLIALLGCRIASAEISYEGKPAQSASRFDLRPGTTDTAVMPDERFETRPGGIGRDGRAGIRIEVCATNFLRRQFLHEPPAAIKC